MFLINIASKNLLFFIQHTSTRGLYSQPLKELDSITPDECLTEISDFSHCFLREHPQEILFWGKSSCQAVFFTKTASMPVLSHNANAKAVFISKLGGTKFSKFRQI
jgi:hypothetical protein